MSECQAGCSPAEEVAEEEVDVDDGDDDDDGDAAASPAAAASSTAESAPFSGDSQNNSLSGESVGHAPPAPACDEGREGKAEEKERREERRWLRRG